MTNTKAKLKVFTAGILVAIFFAEVLIRLCYGQLATLSNFLDSEYTAQLRHTPHIHSSSLGWAAPRSREERVSFLTHTSAGFFENRTFMGFDSFGFRKNQIYQIGRSVLETSPLLALGDSFTLGSEVNDNETWPAHLEQLLHRRVFNGGFARYGLDQMFILLKEVWPQVRPKVVLISLTVKNILRVSETQRISHFFLDRFDKPYFSIEGPNEKLVLRNVPISERLLQPKLGGLRALLGHSLLAHFILKKIAYPFWYGVPNREDLKPLGVSKTDPGKLACLILRAITTFSKSRQAEVVILLQDYYQPSSQKSPYHSTPLLDYTQKCARDMGITVVDFRPTLANLFHSDPYKYESLFFPYGHMTNFGNFTVAHQLATQLREND